MWIVARDLDYYPKIYKFEKEEDARKEYNSIKEDINIGGHPEDDSCVFIAEVKEYTKGKEYEIIDGKTDEEIK